MPGMSDDVPASAPPEGAAPPRGWGGMLRNIFRDQVTSAPVVFSAGNLIWSLATAEKYGIALNAAVLLAAALAQVRDSLRGKQSGLSFFVTAGVHAASAVSTLVNGTDHIGVKEMFNVLGNDDARRYVFTALGRTGWAFAHFIMGWREKYGQDPKHIGSQPVHAGYADIFMTAADTEKAVNAPALALISAGLAKAFHDAKHPAGEGGGVRGFLNRHVTPNRLYASTFVLGAVEAVGNPFYAAAQALWGYGYTLLDGKRNRELGAEAKEGVKKLTEKITSSPS
jgi:hypothetical protein